MLLIIILVGFMILGFVAQSRLKKKFKKYSEVGLQNGLTGREIAEKMLYDHNIRGVRVISTPGQLTDHYNPKERTINLSEDVYYGHSVASAAVAAHETGHAVQHARAYSWLEFRSAMVPVVSFSNKALGFIFIAMFFGAAIFSIFPFTTVLWAVILMQGSITVFSLVTLPVEYDASNRALAWLENENMTSAAEHNKAKDALNAAASTYLVAALASLTQLAYYVLLLVGMDD